MKRFVATGLVLTLLLAMAPGIALAAEAGGALPPPSAIQGPDAIYGYVATMTWAGVPGADHYVVHVDVPLGSSEYPEYVFETANPDELKTPPGEGDIEGDVLGVYTVTVASVDADGFHGPWSAPKTVEFKDSSGLKLTTWDGLSQSAEVVDYGGAVTVSSRLLDAEQGTPIAGKTVQVLAEGSDQKTPFATLVTDENGRVSFTASGTATQADSPGFHFLLETDEEYLGSASEASTFRVRPRTSNAMVSLSAATVKRGAAFNVSWKLGPSSVAGPVTLYVYRYSAKTRRYALVYRSSRSARAADPAGQALFSLSGLRLGATGQYRALWVYAGEDFAPVGAYRNFTVY
jgi:5-hydroxyisourate hydrolase-like protein (transthyretin family)